MRERERERDHHHRRRRSSSTSPIAIGHSRSLYLSFIKLNAYTRFFNNLSDNIKNPYIIEWRERTNHKHERFQRSNKLPKWRKRKFLARQNLEYFSPFARCPSPSISVCWLELRSREGEREREVGLIWCWSSSSWLFRRREFIYNIIGDDESCDERLSPEYE